MIPLEIRVPRAPRILSHLIRVGLTAADPDHAVRRSVSRRGNRLTLAGKTYRLGPPARLVVIGAGKAAGRMAAAVERKLGPLITDGLVTTVRAPRQPRTRRIAIVEAGHPIPDGAGRRAAARMLAMARNLGPQDLVCVLLSGGASSLMPAPASGLTLRDLRLVTEELLRSGAPIHETNVVRKHLSAIGGGRLAAATRARIVTLVLSDVLGDDLGAIGSGPTAPDASTYGDAVRILRRRRLWPSLPSRVRNHLAAGLRGEREDTPKPGAPIFRRVRHVVIGNNRTALRAVAQAARQAGLMVRTVRKPLTGDVRTVARAIGACLDRIDATRKASDRATCVVAGGEPTVKVTGRGRGGRAQHCALMCASRLKGRKDVWLALFGTDGIDGPTEAAGAVVNEETLARARRAGVSASVALRRHDSYTFFRRVGGHLVTGPTGTNVNDLMIGLAL